MYIRNQGDDMKKDKQASIRINSEILKKIKESGNSVQRIIDEYIKANYTIRETIEIKAKDTISTDRSN